MERFEKVMIILAAACFLSLLYIVHYAASTIEEAGGLRAVIVETGKELKSISEEIGESNE